MNSDKFSFADGIRKFLQNHDDCFIQKFIEDMNNFAFELKKLGYATEDILLKIYENGETLHNTTGKNFYADYQILNLSDDKTLYCFQLPGGGNVYYSRLKKNHL